jgi:hypothetical protein
VARGLCIAGEGRHDKNTPSPLGNVIACDGLLVLEFFEKFLFFILSSGTGGFSNQVVRRSPDLADELSMADR